MPFFAFSVAVAAAVAAALFNPGAGVPVGAVAAVVTFKSSSFFNSLDLFTCLHISGLLPLSLGSFQ